MRGLKKFILPFVLACGIGGIVAAPASAHLGDYNAQYAKTYAESVAIAKTYSQWKFQSSSFMWSAAYGEHSRQFHYMIRWSRVVDGHRFRCELQINIDHTLGMFGRQWLSCADGW